MVAPPGTKVDTERSKSAAGNSSGSDPKPSTSAAKAGMHAGVDSLPSTQNSDRRETPSGWGSGASAASAASFGVAACPPFYVLGTSSPETLPSTPAKAGSSPLPSYLLWRPVAASPFALAQQARPMLLPPNTLPPLPPPAVADERSEEVYELLQHRARQEATLTAGSGGQTSSGGHTQSTSTGTDSTPTRLLSSSLPPSLAEWVIPHTSIEYLRHPDGSLHELGAGARCTVARRVAQRAAERHLIACHASSRPMCPCLCSGRVIKAIWNNEIVAAKEVKLDKGVDVQEAFVAEAVRLLGLRHPSIVGFFGVSLDDAGHGIIIMEYCASEPLE